MLSFQRAVVLFIYVDKCTHAIQAEPYSHINHLQNKISTLYVPMQDNNSSLPPIRLSLPLPPSLSSFFSFVSYCLPAVLISAPLIFQPMNWSSWLYHSYYQLQPSFYLCSIFLPLFLTQPSYCCSIYRHAISNMNNATRETKIAALFHSLGWDLFCSSLTESIWVDFYSAVPATL